MAADMGFLRNVQKLRDEESWRERERLARDDKLERKANRLSNRRECKAKRETPAAEQARAREALVNGGYEWVLKKT